MSDLPLLVELAAIAATDVDGATTILNDPSRILLNDYARATVGGLTFTDLNPIESGSTTRPNDS